MFPHPTRPRPSSELVGSLWMRRGGKATAGSGGVKGKLHVGALIDLEGASDFLLVGSWKEPPEAAALWPWSPTMGSGLSPAAELPARH